MAVLLSAGTGDVEALPPLSPPKTAIDNVTAAIQSFTVWLPPCRTALVAPAFDGAGEVI